MPKRKKKRPTYPYQIECALCDSALIVYARNRADADIKIAGKGWMARPSRCQFCVAAAAQIRTGVLEVRA